MSILSGIGQIPSVFGGGGVSNFSPLVFTCDVLSSAGGGLPNDYLLSGAVPLQANTQYLVTINIPVFNISVGEVDFTDIVLQVQTNTAITYLLPDYQLVSNNDNLTLSFILTSGSTIPFNYIQLFGTTSPALTTFDFGGGNCTFIQLNNF